MVLTDEFPNGYLVQFDEVDIYRAGNRIVSVRNSGKVLSRLSANYDFRNDSLSLDLILTKRELEYESQNG